MGGIGLWILLGIVYAVGAGALYTWLLGLKRRGINRVRIFITAAVTYSLVYAAIVAASYKFFGD